MDHLRGDGDSREVHADQGSGRERVGDAAFEDQIDVHEAVAHDRPAERKWDQDERQAGHFGERARNGKVRHVGDGVEERERGDGEQGSAGEPLELLTLQARSGAAIAEAEDDGSHDVKESEVADGDLVEAMMEDFGGGLKADGGKLQSDEEGSWQIERGNSGSPEEAALPAEKLAFREAGREVEKERRLKRPGGDVSPVDDLVEGVQLARVLEGVENKRGEAEDVEVRGFRSGPPAKQDIDADHQVDRGYEAEALVDRAIGRFEDDGNFESGGLAGMGSGRDWTEDGVRAVGPDTAAKHFADKWGEPRRGPVVDCDQQIAGAHAGTLGRRAGGHTLCPDAAFCLLPPGAVGWYVVVAFKAEVCCRETASQQSREGKEDGEDPGVGRVFHFGPSFPAFPVLLALSICIAPCGPNPTMGTI